MLPLWPLKEPVGITLNLEKQKFADLFCRWRDAQRVLDRRARFRRVGRFGSVGCVMRGRSGAARVLVFYILLCFLFAPPEREKSGLNRFCVYQQG
ncbi:hypothetical protein TSUD_130700 [Trifolium subterraneum]|nr:hypothetical protein TSUD_130700 [Trifolium subterraneum]